MATEVDLTAEMDAAEEIVMGREDAHRPGPKRMAGRRVTQDCWTCGQSWPCDGSWQARAEAAEKRLDTIRVHCRGHLAIGGMCCPHLAEEILAITGSGEEARDV